MNTDNARRGHSIAKGTPLSNTNDEFLDKLAQTKRRKIEHIGISREANVRCQISTLLECVTLIHNALTEIDKDKNDLTIEFLEVRADAPLAIAAITGRHPATMEVNKRPTEAA